MSEIDKIKLEWHKARGRIATCESDVEAARLRSRPGFGGEGFRAALDAVEKATTEWEAVGGRLELAYQVVGARVPTDYWTAGQLLAAASRHRRRLVHCGRIIWVQLMAMQVVWCKLPDFSVTFLASMISYMLLFVRSFMFCVIWNVAVSVEDS